MRLHRFYIETPILEEGFELNDRDIIHQWRKVFRYNVGSQVVMFDGSGFDYLCMISELKPSNARLVVVKKKEVVMDIRKNIWLCVGLIKKDNFELVVQKASELGVSGIVPVLCERSEKRKINTERLQKIVIESAEQSGRGDLLEIKGVETIQSVLDKGFLPQEKIALHPSGTSFGFYKSNTKQASFAIFTGPEGGFTDSEIEIFKKYNIQILSLGSQILRAETANIAVASLFLI